MKAQVLHTYDPALVAPTWVTMAGVADPKIKKSSDVIVRIGGAGVSGCYLGRNERTEGVGRLRVGQPSHQAHQTFRGQSGAERSASRHDQGTGGSDPMISGAKINSGRTE